MGTVKMVRGKLVEHGDKMRRVGELLAAGWDEYSGAELVFRGISIANAGGELRLAGAAYKAAWNKIDTLYRSYSATESLLMKIYRDKISARAAKPGGPGGR